MKRTRSRRRQPELGNEAPMVITPRAMADLARRTYRLLRGSSRRRKS
jgi:hypothetical protein